MKSPRDKDKKDLVSRITDVLLGEMGRYRETGTGEGGEQLFNGGRLRQGIRDEMQKEGGPLGKFLGLVESFREIIPDEDKRYSAALKALAQASDLSPEDILGAAESRLSDFKKLEQGLSSAADGWREDLKELEARSREIKAQISQLQDRLRQLQEEEGEVLDRLAAGEEGISSAVERAGAVLKDLEQEIKEIKGKIVLNIDREAPSGVETAPAEGRRQKGGPSSGAAQGKRACPNCSGQMDWYEVEKTWKCFVCAHEEAG